MTEVAGDARGKPAVIPEVGIRESTGNIHLLADTDHSEWGKFLVGRLLKHDTVIQPDGSWISTAYLIPPPPGIIEFLLMWEDWELEHNGDVYGGYFELTGYGHWEPVEDVPRDIKRPWQRKKFAEHGLNKIPKEQLPKWLQTSPAEKLDKVLEKEAAKKQKNPLVSWLEKNLDGVVDDG